MVLWLYLGHLDGAGVSAVCSKIKLNQPGQLGFLVIQEDDGNWGGGGGDVDTITKLELHEAHVPRANNTIKCTCS